MPGFDFALYDLSFYGSQVLVFLILLGAVVGLASLPIFFGVLFVAERVLGFLADRGPNFLKYLMLMLRTLKRNLLRTSLAYLATFVLVFVATSIMSVLHFIDQATSEKEGNLKGIITEKFHNPSGMSLDMPGKIWDVAINQPEQYQPKSYRVFNFIKSHGITRAEDLLTQMPPDLRPKNLDEARAMMETQQDDDIMLWSFIFGSIDPDKQTFESMVFMFAMEPRKLKTMMPGVEDLPDSEMKQLEAAIAKMEKDRCSIIVGRDRLRMLQKRVGDKITIYSKSYKDLTFECEIIGEMPAGRWDQATAVNVEYFTSKLEEYKKNNKNTPHEGEKNAIAIVWLRLPTKEAFQHVAEVVNNPKTFATAVKMETESSAIGSFLDAYRGLLHMAKWRLVPAILATMCLVIANAISISVRERRTEMAVLKVLGFSPNTVMAFILGEAILVGVVAGLLSVSIAYFAVNKVFGGMPFPIGFFPKFFIPTNAFVWGLAFGAATAALGSVLPAWSARNVKASDVFAKVA